MLAVLLWCLAHAFPYAGKSSTGGYGPRCRTGRPNRSADVCGVRGIVGRACCWVFTTRPRLFALAGVWVWLVFTWAIGGSSLGNVAQWARPGPACCLLRPGAVLRSPGDLGCFLTTCCFLRCVLFFRWFFRRSEGFCRAGVSRTRWLGLCGWRFPGRAWRVSWRAPIRSPATVLSVGVASYAALTCGVLENSAVANVATGGVEMKTPSVRAMRSGAKILQKMRVVMTVCVRDIRCPLFCARHQIELRCCLAMAPLPLPRLFV